MALTESAVNELFDALKAGDGVDQIRDIWVGRSNY